MKKYRDLFSKSKSKRDVPKKIADLLEQKHLNRVTYKTTYYVNGSPFRKVVFQETCLSNTYLNSKGKKLHQGFDRRGLDRPIPFDFSSLDFVKQWIVEIQVEHFLD